MKSKFKAALVVALVLVGVSCGSDHKGKTNSTAQDAAIATANNRAVFKPVNDVEGKNYNARQKLADNPATIIWCSAYPTNPNVKPFTVPIVGKLTSGNKRPYATQRAFAGGADGQIAQDYYEPEIPGPDGFYGTSGEYRYGFDPAGNYWDYYNVEAVCTSEPTLIQKNTTDISVSVNPASIITAEAALKVCRAADPDPSKPCDAAVVALTP